MNERVDDVVDTYWVLLKKENFRVNLVKDT